MSKEISKRVCCTCLCEDRKLFMLCRMPDGVNLIYMLLMCDTEAYREGFFKETASWLVCWECGALIKKIQQFQLQACTAMKHLKDIVEGRKNEMGLYCLSHLSIDKNPSTIIEADFVDCGLDLNKIKKESTDLYNIEEDYSYEDEPTIKGEAEEIKKPEIKETKIKTIDRKKENIPTYHENVTVKGKGNVEINKKGKKQNINRTNRKKEYTVTVMDNEELKKSTDLRRLNLKKEFQCNPCILEFEYECELNTHNLEFHTKNKNHTQCDICLSYIKDDLLTAHTRNHYKSYSCKLCNHKVYTQEMMLKHLKEMHEDTGRKKKLMKKAIKLDEPVKYPCTECDMIFENKGAKWKHVQKFHRAGHKCGTCQKVFTFKHNLQRHQLNHTGPHPRSECPQCHKQVRTSLLASHARTHAVRARVACVPCGKAFVCRATYETHLKYASAHAVNSVLRHACSQCDKKYRSGGELRDHIAYRHDAQARHKCPLCDKFLATRRCVTRHVRRAHDGIKENARDKMCDYCGKAFRDKKSLVEHVSRHTGERPYACGRCGRTFRQRAALYAHTRRLHAHT